MKRMGKFSMHRIRPKAKSPITEEVTMLEVEGREEMGTESGARTTKETH